MPMPMPTADAALGTTGNDERQPIPPSRVDFAAEDRAWIVARISDVLASGRLTLGRYGQEFEAAFARYTGASHAIAVASGTAALEIILRAIDVRGADVLVPANTFFATAAAVVHAGGRPVLMDTDATTLQTTPEEIERRITPKTAAALIVHLGGAISGRMAEIVDVCQRRGIALIEDAAHAHGSRLGGRHAGTFGIAGAFSFYPTKVMTSAEGGMIITDDARIAEEACAYRDQGKGTLTRNIHLRLGYNWRLSEPHAIIGLRHLQRLGEMVAARRRIASLYDQGLDDQGLADLGRLSRLPIAAACYCNYYKYIAVLAENRDRDVLKSALKEKWGIALASEVYEVPLHRNPVFADCDPGGLTAAERFCSRHICLPIFASMTDSEAERVIEAVAAELRR